jgi:hypothetical protein
MGLRGASESAVGSRQLQRRHPAIEAVGAGTPTKGTRHDDLNQSPVALAFVVVLVLFGLTALVGQIGTLAGDTPRDRASMLWTASRARTLKPGQEVWRLQHPDGSIQSCELRDNSPDDPTSM